MKRISFDELLNMAVSVNSNDGKTFPFRFKTYHNGFINRYEVGISDLYDKGSNKVFCKDLFYFGVFLNDKKDDISNNGHFFILGKHGDTIDADSVINAIKNNIISEDCIISLEDEYGLNGEKTALGVSFNVECGKDDIGEIDVW